MGGLTPSGGGAVTLIIATRRVSPREVHKISIGFAALPAIRQFTLGGLFSPQFGMFTIDTTSGSAAPAPPILYISSDARAGLFSVDAVNTTDSLLAGTFSFEASRTPDTSAHRMLSGQYRVRYIH